MNTWKLSITVFTLLFVLLVFSSGVYSYPSDVIIEYPTGLVTGDNDSVITFDSVRNELSADGEWIKVNQDEIDSASVTDGSTEFDDDINTDYVWRPYNVDENWSPYTNGYWTYTNCGWMWVSSYNWGWRPYHYGRWWWSARWGWVWSPGYIWAPAWVVWMFYDGYCGWYPLSPRVRWRHHRHHHGYYCHHVRFRVRHWIFCHNYNFHSVPINHTVIIDPYQNGEILKHSKFASDIEYANGIVTNKGPELKEIEKSAGKKIVAEDVKKYNTTKKVDEYLKRNSEENQNPEIQVKGNQNNEQKREEKKNESVNKNQERSKEQNKNKTETPKQETPKQETPKQETPKQEAPKQERPKQEAPKQEIHKQEAPKQEAPKQEAPKQEAPKYEASKQERKNESPPQNKQSNDKKDENNNKPNEDTKQNGNKR